MPPEAGMPSIPSRTRRHPLSRIRTALSHRRNGGDLPGPGSRASARSGVSPIAAGASRGVAFLVRR